MVFEKRKVERKNNLKSLITKNVEWWCLQTPVFTLKGICILKKFTLSSHFLTRHLQKLRITNWKFAPQIFFKILILELTKNNYPNLLDNCPPPREKIFPNCFFQKNILQFVFYEKMFFPNLFL
jgi:hypothetical protein